MAIEGKTTVKTWFETGDKPTETQFSSWIDSGVFHPEAGNFGWLKSISTAETTAVSKLEIADVSGLNTTVLQAASAAFASSITGFVFAISTGAVTAYASGGLITVDAALSAVTTSQTLTAWISALQAFTENRAVYKIATVTADGTAAVSFTGLTSAFAVYEVEFHRVLPAINANSLYMRVSSDNGTSYDSGASDYRWCAAFVSVTAAGGGSEFKGDDADSEVVLVSGVGASAGAEVGGSLRIHNPHLASNKPKIDGRLSLRNTSNIFQQVSFSGERTTNTQVDAIRFVLATGNFSTGIFHLYGYRN